MLSQGSLVDVLEREVIPDGSKALVAHMEDLEETFMYGFIEVNGEIRHGVGLMGEMEPVGDYWSPEDRDDMEAARFHDGQPLILTSMTRYLKMRNRAEACRRLLGILGSLTEALVRRTTLC